LEESFVAHCSTALVPENIPLTRLTKRIKKEEASIEKGENET
jgi:hypothetical protein